MDSMDEKMEPLINTTNFMTKYDYSCETHTNDSLGHAYDPDEVMSPQAEVYISQKMTTTYDNPHDTLSGLKHSVFNVMDPGEVYVGPKELSNNFVNHEVPNLIPEHMENRYLRSSLEYSERET